MVRVWVIEKDPKKIACIRAALGPDARVSHFCHGDEGSDLFLMLRFPPFNLLVVGEPADGFTPDQIAARIRDAAVRVPMLVLTGTAGQLNPADLAAKVHALVSDASANLVPA